MAREDHLDKETSISGEITPTGVKASAKSRFVAAVDRLGGNLVELLNAPIEAKTAEKRAVTDGRVRAIEAVTSLALERLKTDPEFAERAMRAHLGSVLSKQENKDAVIEKTVEDLRRLPPTDQEAVSGADKLDDTFVTRFERYAEEATTEDLREKWGRVLAAEIRRPDTFSGKVLRVIDELDADTARLFERVCQFRLKNVIPKALLGELSFNDTMILTNADLLVEPELGQTQISAEGTDSGGTNLWLWGFGSRAIALTKTSPLPSSKEAVLQVGGEKPALPVYVLTDVGLAISSILPDLTAKAVAQLAEKLADAAPLSEVRQYVMPQGTTDWMMVSCFPPKQQGGNSAGGQV